MPPPILYHLAHTRMADLHRQVQRDAPGLAASRASRRRTAMPEHRGRPAATARRMLTMLGGGSP